MLNLNSTTPAAPIGGFNINFQLDSSANVSAYVSLSNGMTTVNPVSGVATLNAALGNTFLIQVSTAITSIVVTNPTDGQQINLLIYQSSTGFPVAYGSNFYGGVTPSTTMRSYSTQSFIYNAANGNWYATSVGIGAEDTML
jgi:hypothetical protein